ncbi:MAG: nucleotidyltransferase family protein, partial [Acetobacteraceae bacterium]
MPALPDLSGALIDHLRYAGADPAIQERALRDIIAQSACLTDRLTRAQDWNLPDWWIVSGAIYNTVWNRVTGRPDMYGVKDVDLFYFDEERSYEAEDRLIRQSGDRFPGTPAVELRNQARVHLWYPTHFGQPYPQLSASHQAIDHFACRTHCIGARLTEAGLDDIFSFRLTPNPVLDNRAKAFCLAVLREGRKTARGCLRRGYLAKGKSDAALEFRPVDHSQLGPERGLAFCPCMVRRAVVEHCVRGQAEAEDVVEAEGGVK